MRVVVLGAAGMAGHMVSRYLRLKGHNVIDVTRNGTPVVCDFENQDEVDNLFYLLAGDKIDYVINCVGLLVADSNSRPDRAAKLNAWLPHYVEHKLSNTDTKLIHLSTDCVFDGAKGFYFEEDTHTETNYYGRSKSFGEVNNNKDVTFRMSIIGPEVKESGTGLFHWFVNNSPDQVDGWDNAIWNGITTLELAKCIDQYIQKPTQTGIVHLVNNDNRISKYSLLSLINDIFEVGKSINRVSGPKSVNKCLVNTKKDYGISDYETQLKELKEFIHTPAYDAKHSHP